MKYVSTRRDKNKETNYIVTEDTTLLPFLLATIKGKSRNNVKSLLARKLVAIDGKPESRFDTPLKAGQTVTILSVSAPYLEGLPFQLIYEDEHIIAVNKPAGLLSVGNIVGANIIDLTLILPACALVSGGTLTVSPQTWRLDMPVCLGVILLAMLIPMFKKSFYRWQGVLLVAGYAAYLVVLVTMI